MLRRVLLLFGNESNTKQLLEAGNMFKSRYNCDVKALYVKDVRKHEILPPSIEGLVMDSSSRYLIDEWDRFENEQIENLKKKLSGISEQNFKVTEGITPDVVLEELKGYDLVVVGKGKKISADLKELLKYHYKPMLILGEKKLDLDKILYANDGSFRSNKSIFRFLGMFDDVKDINSLSVDISEDDTSLKEYLKGSQKVLIKENKVGNEFEILKEESKKYGILVMGDLTHSYLLEKITGHIGVKLIEELDISIFIA